MCSVVLLKDEQSRVTLWLRCSTYFFDPTKLPHNMGQGCGATVLLHHVNTQDGLSLRKFQGYELQVYHSRVKQAESYSLLHFPASLSSVLLGCEGADHSLIRCLDLCLISSSWVKACQMHGAGVKSEWVSVWERVWDRDEEWGQGEALVIQSVCQEIIKTILKDAKRNRREGCCAVEQE